MPKDFAFRDHGSICLLQPLTRAAAQWVVDNLPGDAQRWCGAIVIEPRYVEPILLALEGDGFVIGKSTSSLH